MIPIAQIIQWRNIAPWADDLQVEQDLILSRVLIDIFSNDFLRQQLAFRGGTALHKLFFSPAARYSEDIDLVRTSTGPIVTIADELQAALKPWLGTAKTKRTAASFKLFYYFTPETSPNIKLRIKIEINVRETFSVLDRISKPFIINLDWFSGHANINTFHLNELIATKVRALYQRSKGRDLFDLWLALREEDLDIQQMILTFHHYLKQENNSVTQKQFKRNLSEKLACPIFTTDIEPLLSPEFTQLKQNREGKGQQNIHHTWNLPSAANEVENRIISQL